jgi:hypothetical protein
MTHLQSLLNREATLSNDGKGDCEERQQILTAIRLIRDDSQIPVCFGEDDCSTRMLSICPWRFDCGTN